ncbi:hypothetical protein ABMA27_004686 [Loxostege sticticalis]|uniref:MADF domain-containing protein n=1 Tax=Loxostege sticticalis TaxID=481309 RepID=A0ABR3HKA9_LOXSC
MKMMDCNKTEELINLVKIHPVLYDTTHDDYKINRVKNKIWETIAEAMQEPDPDVPKSRWKNLRDSYYKHLRAMNGEESKYIDRYKTWPWVNQISFLQPFIEMIPTRSNRGVKKVLSKASKKLQVPTEIKIEDSTSSDIPNEEPIFVDSHGMMEPQPEVSQYYGNSNIDNNHTNNVSTVDYDETDLIFLGYSKLIKKLSRRQQAAVKYKIAKVIMDAEMEDAESPPLKKLKPS